MLTQSLPSDLLAAAHSIAPRIVDLRRAIHAEPELGLETPLTLAKVRAELADLPLEWKTGTSATGAVATLKGGQSTGNGPGKSALLRGDMDALPMPEHTGLPYASTIAGRMHACGHDTHTAMLAGAARILAARQAEIAGEVRFMFQPGEEGFHGARHMINDGLLNPLPDAAFALHIMPNSPHGIIAGKPGAMLAAADQFDIVVRGRGGHASLPHDTADPVPAAAAIVGAFQAMVTRRFAASEATVVTVSQIDAGTAHNIIPDSATMRGTVRTLSPERRVAVHAALTEVAQHTARAHGCEAEVVITEGFPVTINDPRAIALGKAVALDMAEGEGGWHAMAHSLMGAEDFSYVLQQVPGAMFFLGVAHQGEDWTQCCGIHSSRMIVDESAMPKGSAFLAACALRFLDAGWS